MTPEQTAALISAQVALLNCRVAGMVAENMQRQHLGESMAFAEDEFSAVEIEFERVLGHNAVITLFRDAQP